MYTCLSLNSYEIEYKENCEKTVMTNFKRNKVLSLNLKPDKQKKTHTYCVLGVYLKNTVVPKHLLHC